jgi:hypothetical protein
MFHLISGIILLALGRQLFWLFVAVIGVVIGFEVAQGFFPQAPYWAALLIGTAGGVMGGLLAIFFQKVAVGIAGFAAGGAVTAHLMVVLGWKAIPLFVLAGAIMGAILLYLFFDWGLILLSSMAGALQIVLSLNWPRPHELLLYLVLTLVGILYQSMLLLRQRPKRRDPL